MKILIEKLPHLKALYVKQLRTMLDAEDQVTIGLERMFETAIDPELKQTLQSAWRESEVHVERLRDVVRRATIEPDTVKCKVLQALMDETEDMIKEAAHDPVRDAALIGAAQKVMHYQIAAYGTVRRFAEILGLTMDAELLGRTLQEEKDADRQLTTLADRVNLSAAGAAAA